MYKNIHSVVIVLINNYINQQKDTIIIHVNVFVRLKFQNKVMLPKNFKD